MKSVVIDVEANALHNPTKIWCIVCKEIDNDPPTYTTFREENLNQFKEYSNGVSTFIGHNLLGWDSIVLSNLLSVDISGNCLDTLILSKMIDYPRDGHSIEDYGKEFGIEKDNFNDFSRWSQRLEDRCRIDTDICHRIYLKYKSYINKPMHHRAIATEHKFQMVVNSLQHSGFAFDKFRCTRLLEKVTEGLGELDDQIREAFKPKLVLVREITPRITMHGTLNRSDFRWYKGEDLSEFNGGPFCRCIWRSFNPSSPKQIVDVLNDAGWKPVDRTKTHIQALREKKVTPDQIKYGWRINENNLNTLPDKAPKPARLLSKRILLESRRRTLTEWSELVGEDGRMHGKFYAIGAWTHRMAHQNPNMANIPTPDKLYGKEMRSLWRAPRNRLLVGVDAKGIQLRVFAHYIDDKEFTDEVSQGDPHSLNQRVLGDVCKSRDAAKTFIYAMLLGGRTGKFAEIFDSTIPEAEEAYGRILRRYPGLEILKAQIVPKDARRGWFKGLDDRRVRIPGSSVGERSHLCMAGYLQNGERVIMAMAANHIFPRLGEYDAFVVNIVHDEFQFECPNDFAIALALAKEAAASIKWAGEELGLRCPMEGDYWSKHHNDYSIGTNWSYTH